MDQSGLPKLFKGAKLRNRQVVRHGAFLGAVASGMAGVLFPFLYFVSGEITSGFEVMNDSVYLQGAVVAFLILGPPCAVLIALPAGVLGGGALALVFRRLQNSGILQIRLAMLAGAIAGGLYGLVWVLLVEWSYGVPVLTPGPDIAGGALAGVIAGAWYSNRMTRWLSRAADTGPA
jgi:hypothetical protein